MEVPPSPVRAQWRHLFELEREQLHAAGSGEAEGADLYEGASAGHDDGASSATTSGRRRSVV
jgi:hypothetical protein